MMVSKKYKKIIMLVLALAAAAWSAYQDKSSTFDSDLAHNINKQLIYTKHAKCRMKCRQLDKSEVKDLISNGKVNKRKSNANASPCPVIAKEKSTKDKQYSRVVYADCPDKIKVITVIDLDNKYNCSCD